MGRFIAVKPGVLLRRGFLLAVILLVSCFKQPETAPTNKTTTTGGGPDTTAPSAPGSLTATAIGAVQISLAWAASTDDVGVTAYAVERCQGAGCSNFSEIATPSSSPWSDTGLGLQPSTQYSYRVRARDAANNFSDYSNVAGDTTLTVIVSLTPRNGGLTLGQSVVITANVTNDFGAGGVTWSVSGSGGGFTSTNRTSATFSAPTAGAYTITATSIADGSTKGSATVGVTDLAGVFTNRYDSQRTGQNQQERALTVANVTSGTFGKLFGCAVDNAIYGQPLYIANLSIPTKGTHNVVFVGTMSNTMYAFDADDPGCAKLWQVSLLGNGETPVPVDDTDPLHPGANDIQGLDIGIMGTPVIDPATKTLYVVSKTKDASAVYHQRLHALSIVDGTDQAAFHSPREIDDSITVPGNADTGDAGIFPTTTCASGVAGQVPFCALHQGQRPGLLLSNGRVYVVWAGHDDVEPYHGWVMGFQSGDLSQAPLVFNTTPNFQIYQQTNGQGVPTEPPGVHHAMGGMWQAGTGPAADAAGEIYFGTGNGATDTTDPRANWSDSFLRLTPTLSTLSVSTLCGINQDIQCYFTPIDEQNMRVKDSDLDSGGPMLLPDSAGNPGAPFGLRRHLMIGGDKKSILYLMDRDDMGLYANAQGPAGQPADDTLQQVTLAGMTLADGTPVGCAANAFCGVFSTPSFWNGNIYVAAVNDVVKRFPIGNAVIDIDPTNMSFGGDIFKFPGAQIAISSNGAADGIVWALNTANNGTRNATQLLPTVLFAYNAMTLQKLYSSPVSDPGAAGNSVKFQVPTVANGKVYIGTHDELSVFGLLP